MNNAQYQNLKNKLDAMDRKLKSIDDTLEKILSELKDDLSITKRTTLDLEGSTNPEPEDVVEIIKREYEQTRTID